MPSVTAGTLSQIGETDPDRKWLQSIADAAGSARQLAFAVWGEDNEAMRSKLTRTLSGRIKSVDASMLRDVEAHVTRQMPHLARRPASSPVCDERPALEARMVAERSPTPPQLSDRIAVPVVEVAGGPGGRACISGQTLYVDYLTPSEFVLWFGQPPPPVGSENSRWCIGQVAGESMVPRYDDGDRVPIELFDEALADVAGGDVYLVRLDHHLHLKVVNRKPATREEAAALVLGSYHKAYKPIEVRLDAGVDIAILGRVIEPSKQRLFGALLANQLGL